MIRSTARTATAAYVRVHAHVSDRIRACAFARPAVRMLTRVLRGGGDSGDMAAMLSLIRHPDFACEAVRSVEAEALREGGVLRLRFVLVGAMDRLALAPVRPSVRAHELWRHTCFEAFVGLPGGGYDEFNFAPSTAWAAYRFDDYRQSMRDADVEAPRIEVRREGDRFELSATVRLPDDGPWRVGLTAVIEEADDRASYWALAHPPGRPDFHNPDCFALELAGSRGP